jgi:pyrroloquinoline-quinone synthase
MRMNNPDVQASISEALEITRYYDNPYFTQLLNGSFDRDDFCETQIQFYFAVAFFSRPMSALAGKIPDTSLRLNVVRNVFEEHGEGNPSAFHENTFKTLLTRLGVTSEALSVRELWPEVRAFNTALTGVCTMDSYLVGTATLGIIERMFSEISTWIGKGVIANNWLAQQQMIHYSAHEKLDIQHSQEFFEILETPWRQGAQERYFIRQGLLMGAYIFNNLYTGLYQARQRRLFREYLGPHTFQ